MATIEQFEKIFGLVDKIIFVDDMYVESFTDCTKWNDYKEYEDPMVYIRCAETTNFEDGITFYYEWEIDKYQWDAADVVGNEILIKYKPDTLLHIKVYDIKHSKL